MATATAIASPVLPKAERSHLPVIMAIAIAARIVMLLVYAHAHPLPDLRHWGSENIYIALSIHDGHGYASPFLAPSGPTAFMTPIYPIIIAGFISVFGTGSFAAWMLIISQVMLSLLTLLVVMHVAADCFGVRTANLAGFIFAVSRPILEAPLYIWDTCISALILAVAILFAPSVKSRSHFAAAGVGCALATLINPSLLPTLIVIFGWSAWRARVIPWLGMLAFVLVFSGWPIRNYEQMHAFIPLRSNAGYELWLGNHPGTDGESPEEAGPGYHMDARRLFLAEGEVAYMHQKTELAKAWIMADPAQFAKLTTIRFVRFWSGSSKSPTPLTIPLVIAGIAGLLLLWRSKSLFVLFAIPLAIYPLPYYITHADARYQFVIDPLLAILAGYACECFLAFFARRPMPTPSISSELASDQPSA